MKRTLFICFIVSAIASYGQEITITHGDLAFLKGQPDIKLQYDYENIAIANGGTEKEYKAKKVAYLNNKEAGRGDKWERLWNQYRIDHFESAFKELFIKHSTLAVNESATYTLIFKAVQFHDPALLVPPDKEPDQTKKIAFMDGEAWIVETKNPANILCKISMTKIPGRDLYLNSWGTNTSTMASYDVRVRLSYTYAKAGKELGTLIAEKLK